MFPVDVVKIAGSLYCKNQQALDSLFNHLSEDYDIEKSDKYDHYYARLKKSVCQDACKCNYCNHYNTHFGCKVHGFTCSGCDKILYKQYIPRSPIQFSFRYEERYHQLNFIIHSYDMETHTLYVYDKVQKRRAYGDLNLGNSLKMLEKHKDSYVRTTINGKKVLGFYCRSWSSEDGDQVKINITSVGHPPYKMTRNPDKSLGYDYELAEEDKGTHYHQVRIFKGQEYPGYSDLDLPVPVSYMIYPHFEKAKVNKNFSAGILRIAGMSSNCGYYYQDGSQAVYPVHLESMKKFVEHFTTLDLVKFTKFLELAPLDGPEFIVALAKFVEACTGVYQYVENKPNIGNVIHAACKVMSKQLLTDGEYRSAVWGLQDDHVRETWHSLVESIRNEQE